MVYGGHRPGDNLYSDSLVAIEARTGERVWHFQMVHHDIWEYDTVGPPTLGQITVDGRRIDAVMQPSKTAFLYVFDRRTGEPVWPIEEREVPQSIVPGERTSPTQPFPTKPPPFDRQGVSVDDLIDFTPELRAEAMAAVESLVLGPLFTPPWPQSDDPDAKQGTLTAPGGWGAGNWHTGAFESGDGLLLRGVAHDADGVERGAHGRRPEATLAWATPRGAARRVPTPAAARTADRQAPLRPDHRVRLSTAASLPGWRPTGTGRGITRCFGTWICRRSGFPTVRRRSSPRRCCSSERAVTRSSAPYAARVIRRTRAGSVVALGRGFRAYDKATGRVVWETELPAGTTSGPMTYMHEGKQYIVVAVGTRDEMPEWVALALP